MLTGARAAMSWLREGSSVAQQQVIRDFAVSRARALKDVKARLPVRQRAGMPKPKKKREARGARREARGARREARGARREARGARREAR
ncbi:hypothetical protein ACIA5F_02335, partial [Streptomyces sp. NPDC051567]